MIQPRHHLPIVSPQESSNKSSRQAHPYSVRRRSGMHHDLFERTAVDSGAPHPQVPSLMPRFYLSGSRTE
jgi:hypothetical protein